MILYRTNLKVSIITTAIIMFFLSPDMVSASWHDLTPGSYNVGFKTIEKYDYSRTFMPKYDYFGNPAEGERARPIQICVWYPAKANPEAQPMVYGEYNFPYPEDDRFYDILSRLQGQDNGFLYFAFQNDAGTVIDFLSVEMNAVKDAIPYEGKFPLLIYFSNLRSGIGDNALLCEYLASQGFVVATSHSYGTHETGGQINQGDLETQISDKEFIFANIKDFPNVDMNKIGAFGSGFGGLAAMLYPMRCGDIDAALSLNNPFIVRDYTEFSSNSPYFSAENLKVPFMNMYSNDIGEVDLSLLDSLRYSERFSIQFPQTPRTAFTSYRLLATKMPGRENTISENEQECYLAICRYTLNFFNAFLNNSETARKFVYNFPEKNKIQSDLMTVSFMTANDIPPSPADFMQIVEGEGGVQKAIEIYEKFKVEEPGHTLFNEATFNQLGYNLLTRGEVDNALVIFKMNTEVYPQSCNVWDSYADGLTAAGDTAKTIECMHKAMECIPNDDVNEAYKDAIRQHARQVLGEEEFAKYNQQ